MHETTFTRLVGATLCATVLFAAPAAYASHPLGTEEPETIAPRAVDG